jgi:predicted nucleotidyltransferase
MKDDFGQPAYTHPPVLDEAGLIAFLKTQPDIVAAYLFGSSAQGRANLRSDIDIAILLKQIPKQLGGATDRQLKLMDDFRGFADREVDVVILNTAPPVLKDQVLRHGRRLFERDRQARVEFEVRAGQEYADAIPVYDFFTQAMFTELREVGLGGRRRNRQGTSAILAQPGQIPQG